MGGQGVFYQRDFKITLVKHIKPPHILSAPEILMKIPLQKSKSTPPYFPYLPYTRYNPKPFANASADTLIRQK